MPRIGVSRMGEYPFLKTAGLSSPGGRFCHLAPALAPMGLIRDVRQAGGKARKAMQGGRLGTAAVAPPPATFHAQLKWNKRGHPPRPAANSC